MMNTFDKWKLGTFGWVIFSYGVIINVSQNRKARTACITPVDKLGYSWYTLGLVFFANVYYFYRAFSMQKTPN